MAYYWTPDSGLPFSDEFREQAALPMQRRKNAGHFDTAFCWDN